MSEWTGKSTGLLTLLERQLDELDLHGRPGDPDTAAPPELWARALRSPLRDFLGRDSKRFRARMVSLGWASTGRARACAARVEPAEELASDLFEVLGLEGRRRIRATLDDALAELRAEIGRSEIVPQIEEEIDRLMRSYD
ncbi:hypothetical protein WME91_08950 [Sorangium sp. So ce269]